MDEERVKKAQLALNEFQRLTNSATLHQRNATKSKTNISGKKKPILSYAPSVGEHIKSTSPPRMTFLSLMTGDPYINTETVSPSDLEDLPPAEI